jgi:hypothetical protein
MEKQLTVLYDKTGDILYIDTCKPYPEQESEELGDEIIVTSQKPLVKFKVYELHQIP